MTTQKTPFLLAILDGLGLNPNPKANAFVMANTPVLDNLLKTYPSTTLTTFGERVGLPEGQMGNSEVGHLNIGAGRVVEQDLTRINRTSKTNSFDKVPAFINLAKKTKENGGKLHLIGLTSPGGVHSEISQLISIIKGAISLQIPNVVIHIITDGRDRPRDAAKHDLTPLLLEIDSLNNIQNITKITIASLVGRYYAMDRDKRWDRTELAYNLYVNGIGAFENNLEVALEKNYTSEVYDEFIKPINLNDSKDFLIKNNDSIIFYNFRADRMRQIVAAFIDENFTGFLRQNHPKLSSVISMCEYDAEFKIDSMFPPIIIKNHFGEIISSKHLSQLRIAETEKYPHVTYFFNGGSEIILSGEERIMVPSPRDVATYDQKPEMSAIELTEKLIERLNNGPLNVIILNFANCDMVGHTGNLNAAIKAVETVDTCLGKILNKIKDLGGSALITADHGNSDQMIDYVTGEPHTYHTMHPVPLIYFGPNAKSYNLLDNGALCDIAPTALQIMGIEKPNDMTGKSLLINTNY